jgi:hypothetical protein
MIAIVTPPLQPGRSAAEKRAQLARALPKLRLDHEKLQPANFCGCGPRLLHLDSVLTKPTTGDAPMTANPQNTGSAIAMLQKALAYSRDKTVPAADRLFHLEIQIDSVLKCFVSLAAQIRNYNSGKATSRSIALRHPDGREEYVSGLALEALRLPLPDLEQDFIIYGKPAALRAVAAALNSRGWPSNGPAQLDALTTELARAAAPDFEPEVGP